MFFSDFDHFKVEPNYFVFLLVHVEILTLFSKFMFGQICITKIIFFVFV